MNVSHNDQIFITMQHATPQFETFNGSKKALAYALDIDEEDIDENYQFYMEVQVFGHYLFQ